MTTSGGTALAELQDRLRLGSAGIAIPSSDIYEVLQISQNTINYGLKRFTTTGSYAALTTNTVVTYYSTSIDVPAAFPNNVHHILGIEDSTSFESLIRCPNWNALQQADSCWYNASATKSLVWAPIGTNMLAVYPASSHTYKVHYVAECDNIVNSGSNFNIPDADMNLLYDVSEAVLLIRMRMFAEAKVKIEQLKEDISLRQRGMKA